MISRKLSCIDMKSYFTLYILCEISIQYISATIDYCKLPCVIDNNIVEHVICTLKNDCSVGSECKVKNKFEITSEMKRSILNIHNLYRNKIALGEAIGKNGVNLPQGADLLEMVWDDELAYFAQCFANKCILQYDKCRQSSARENIEQIIFIRLAVNPRTTDEIILEMIESVFYSSKYLSSEEIEVHKNKKATKEFTQLSWSRTNRVGCGVTKLLEDLYAYFMVCNYGPAGNIEGEKVYQIGLPCSSCPDHQICGTTHTGLCAVKREERNGLGIIPAFLTKLERIVDPSLQKEKSVENSEIDENIDVSEKNSTYNEENENTDLAADNYAENYEILDNFSEDISESNRTAKITPESRQIPVKICKVKRKNDWQNLKRHTGEISSANDIPSIQIVHIILLSLLIQNISFRCIIS